MIVSASRRTDIPAFYGDWLLGRLEEGWVRVPNPFNPKQIQVVEMDPRELGAIVFWTKDPAPLMPRLETMERLGFDRYTFLFTLNDYPRAIEPGLPPLAERVATFRRLARRIGPDRVTWRYDPVILSDHCSTREHIRRFAALARALAGSTRRVVVAMLHRYRKTRRGLARVPGWAEGTGEFPSPATKEQLTRAFARFAAGAGMAIQACAQEGRLLPSIPDGPCIDGDRLGRLFGLPLETGPHRGQRPACRCSRSVDIGVNDTCAHGCLYCYATRDPAKAARLCADQDRRAPSLGQGGPT